MTTDAGGPTGPEGGEATWAELILGRPPRMTRPQIAEEAGLECPVTDRFRQANWFPIVEDD